MSEYLSLAWGLWVVAQAGYHLWFKPRTVELIDLVWDACLYPGGKEK